MKLASLACAGVCLTLSSAAFADTADIKASNNQISFQLTSTHVDYTETGNGRFGSPTGTLDTEKGPVPGYALNYSAMLDLVGSNDYIALQASHNSGHTDYVGQPIDGSGYYGSIVDQSNAKITEGSLRYGKGFETADRVMLTPYGELGWHQWERGVNGGETYTHNWYGIGLLAQFSPASKLVLSANGLLGRTFAAKISIAGTHGFNDSLGDSELYKLGLAADYAFTKNFHGNVGFDYVSFKYGVSAVHDVGGGFVAWEPDSKTKYTTVKFGLGYAF